MKDLLIKKYIKLEAKRQDEHIELIASENFVSKDVLEAAGSVLTNKYAEGYPGARYYDGCKYIDEIEKIAIRRLKKLFNVQYVNVQPHSGSQANAAAMGALLKPGDKIMGMSLTSGGHLTHGYRITFSGTFYKSVVYEVDAQGLINYDQVEALAMQERPQLIICGYSAYSRIINFQRFKQIATKCGAYLMADIAHIAGLVAMNMHPSPVGVADIITSTTHKTLRSARGGIIMTNDPAIAKQVDKWVFPGFQGGPLMHQIAAKAVGFGEALHPSFQTYIKKVVDNARAFSKQFIKLGVPIVAGGTDTHLFTINVKIAYNMSGKAASTLLYDNNITANKNTVPHDPLGPRITSGVRLGTPAMTTKGFNQAQFQALARLIHKLLSRQVSSIKNEVRQLISS